MTDEEARYDRIAEGYARWWSPVHRPATLALLDEIEPAVTAGATRVLDIGCGTGALAAAAVRRWRDVRVTGVDASVGMLTVAARELGALDASIRDRVSLVQATADQLPFADGGFDIVVTAFVLQLVPSRYRALREARRVLGRDGTLAHATWLAGGSFPADDAYADALVAAGLEPRDGGGAHDEPGSPAAAAAQLRRAGFSGVAARPGEVDHRFTPEGFLAFLACFDDEELFATLEPAAREALETDLLERLRALPVEGLRMRLPIAVVTGRRSARP
jgi:ubiquinone/menaquinone biosynthesis C-methylase UbiE